VPLCLDQGVGILVWSPLSGGFLSGKVRRDRRDRRRPRGLAGPGGPELGARQARRHLGDRRPRTEEQLRDNLAAANRSLDADEVARLDDASAIRVPYPQWHQRRDNRERLPEPC
jgi:aryl-alcohol dehydrogenase-like predicted oxidoreductase